MSRLVAFSSSSVALTLPAGQGNIGKDPNTYVEGDIVREGVYGEPSHVGGGEYSAGRGGAGNMVHVSRDSPAPGTPPPGGSEEVIPESNWKRAGEQYEDYHTGRGGGGNVHRDKYGGHSKPQKEHKEGGGLMDKAKHMVGMDKKKEGGTTS